VALDGEIPAGIQDGLVAVIKPDVVRRGSVWAADFQYFAVPVRGLYRPAPDNDAVSLGCLHGNHLPALGYGFLPFGGTGSGSGNLPRCGQALPLAWRMQNGVQGRASSRPSAIRSPQTAQEPYVPAAIRSSAASIWARPELL